MQILLKFGLLMFLDNQHHELSGLDKVVRIVQVTNNLAFHLTMVKLSWLEQPYNGAQLCYAWSGNVREHTWSAETVMIDAVVD